MRFEKRSKHWTCIVKSEIIASPGFDIRNNYKMEITRGIIGINNDDDDDDDDDDTDYGCNDT